MEGLRPDEKEAGRQKRERETSKENIQDANDGLANRARRRLDRHTVCRTAAV